MKLITNLITALAINSCVAQNCSSLNKKNCRKNDGACEFLRLSGTCKNKTDIVCSDLSGMKNLCEGYGCKVWQKTCCEKDDTSCGRQPKPKVCGPITKRGKCKRKERKGKCHFVPRCRKDPWYCGEGPNPTPEAIEQTSCPKPVKPTKPAPTRPTGVVTPAPTTPAPTTPAPTTPAPTTPAPTTPAPTEPPTEPPTEAPTDWHPNGTGRPSGTYCDVQSAYILAKSLGYKTGKGDGCTIDFYTLNHQSGLYAWTEEFRQPKLTNCATYGGHLGNRNNPMLRLGEVRIGTAVDCAPIPAPTYCDKASGKALAESLGYKTSGCGRDFDKGPLTNTRGLYAYTENYGTRAHEIALRKCAFWGHTYAGAFLMERYDINSFPVKHDEIIRLGTASQDICEGGVAPTVVSQIPAGKYCDFETARTLAHSLGYRTGKSAGCGHDFVFTASKLPGLWGYTDDYYNVSYRKCAFYGHQMGDRNAPPSDFLSVVEQRNKIYQNVVRLAPATDCSPIEGPTYCDKASGKALAESLGYKTGGKADGCIYDFERAHRGLRGLYAYSADAVNVGKCAFWGTGALGYINDFPNTVAGDRLRLGIGSLDTCVDSV